LRLGGPGLGHRLCRKGVRAHAGGGADIQRRLAGRGGRATGPLYFAGQNGITWTDASGKTGTIPYPSAPLMSFAATDPAQGGHVLWGTTGDYTVQPPRFKTLFWDGSAWQDSGGPGFNALSIGVDNSVWGYVGNGQLLSPGLYRYNSQGQWVLAVKSPTGGLMQSYAVVDPYDIWAVDNNFKLSRWNGQRWTPQADGSPNWIATGWDGAVYGLNTLLVGAAQALQRFNGFAQWVPMPLTFTYFSRLRKPRRQWPLVGLQAGAAILARRHVAGHGYRRACHHLRRRRRHRVGHRPQ
jgi:hypothetical protein